MTFTKSNWKRNLFQCKTVHENLGREWGGIYNLLKIFCFESRIFSWLQGAEVNNKKTLRLYKQYKPEGIFFGIEQSRIPWPPGGAPSSAGRHCSGRHTPGRKVPLGTLEKWEKNNSWVLFYQNLGLRPHFSPFQESTWLQLWKSEGPKTVASLSSSTNWPSHPKQIVKLP